LECEGIRLGRKRFNPKVKEVIAVNDDCRENEDVEPNCSDKVGWDHDHDSIDEEEGKRRWPLNHQRGRNEMLKRAQKEAG
nr:hypothetical protein [Tanacetum cinerariifolium]